MIVLVGRLACPVPGASRRLVMSAGRRVYYRSLWGRDHHGRFVTRGRYGSASVRGTVWLTRDGCDGTFFRVKRGAVDVHDNGLRRTVALHAGMSYVARKRT